jgi:hypothetical protein
MRAATHKAKKGKKDTFAKVITDKIATGDPIADRGIELALEGMPNHILLNISF